MSLFSNLLLFLRQVFVHFKRHNCAQIATALSYQTLLALVPFAAIAMALVTYFPGFKEMQDMIMAFIFDNFLPTHMDEIQQFITSFAENATHLTIFGLLGLAITALFLLASIEKSFSRIWHVKKNRQLWVRVMTYILILLIGPVATASSLTLVNLSITYLENFIDIEVSDHWNLIALIGPYIILPATFILLYKVVPACHIRWRDAFVGAIVAAMFFNLGKFLFRLYLSSFPTYQIIYGALATIPVFLIWLYVSWAIALIGAVVTAVMGQKSRILETS